MTRANGSCRILALLIRSAFETNQKKHPAPLLVNLREGAIEIAQRQPPVGSVAHVGSGHIVDLDKNAFAHAAPDAVRAACAVGGEAGFRGFYLLKSTISRNITGLSLSIYTQGKLSYYIYRI